MSLIKTDAIQNLAGKPILNSTGSVLQVKSATMTGVQTFAGTAYTDVTDGTNALSVAITPTASSSKFLLYMTVSAGADNGGSRFGFRFMRDSTAVGISDTQGSRTPSSSSSQGSTAGRIDANISMIHLDSPATTSAITYKVQGAVEATGSNLTINRGGTFADNATIYTTISSFTVMEIAG